jgi:hypothetical protein
MVRHDGVSPNQDLRRTSVISLKTISLMSVLGGGAIPPPRFFDGRDFLKGQSNS